MPAGAKKKRVVAGRSRAAKPVAGPDLPAGREGYQLDLAPTHKPVRAYYEELAKFELLGARHEGAVRDAFGTLLKHCAGQVGWTLVCEHPHPRRGRNPAKIDGALLDKWGLVRVHWEAKDSNDDLDKEVRKKLADGYPTDNIVFQAPERAILYQNGHRSHVADIRDPKALVESRQQQLAFMSPANSQRVERQKRSPIFVIIGNPPYNAWQINENDRNKNRKYDVIDRRVKETYAADSDAQLKNSLLDPYVKAFRWATDRLGEEGVLAFITNGSYVSKEAFDGMRRNLGREYDEIYVLDLGGDVRVNPKISGTTHNVFGDKVGIAIGFLVRRRQAVKAPRQAHIFYAKTDPDWRKERKFEFLEAANTCSGIEWTRIQPDEKGDWLTEGQRAEFKTFMPLVGFQARGKPAQAIFQTSSNGIQSNNDSYVFDFSSEVLSKRARKMVGAYNAELSRWEGAGRPKDVDDFLSIDETVLKWVRKTKRHLARGERARFEPTRIRRATYRPFTSQFVFFDRMFNEDTYQLHRLFGDESGLPNPAIVVSDAGHRAPFSVLAVASIPERHLCASTDTVQVMALHTFDEAGTPRDNITDWALEEFRARYRDDSITKLDIFHYVYGILHHEAYRERYAANLKRGRRPARC